MEIAWNKLILWIIAFIVLVIVLFFLYKNLALGGNNPISALFGIGDSQAPPA